MNESKDYIHEYAVTQKNDTIEFKRKLKDR